MYRCAASTRLSTSVSAPLTIRPHFQCNSTIGWLAAEQLIVCHTVCSAQTVMVDGCPESPSPMLGHTMSTHAAPAQYQKCPPLHSALNAQQDGEAPIVLQRCESPQRTGNRPQEPAFRAMLKSALHGHGSDSAHTRLGLIQSTAYHVLYAPNACHWSTSWSVQ